MFIGRTVLNLFLFLFFLTSISSGDGDILLNGTGIYLATGDSYGLYQGYVLGLKSVSNDGSVWLQLTENDYIVKSEIVANNGYFTYNKTNRTILSVKIDSIYSGSSEQNLVSLLLYQFIDPDKPVPIKTAIMPAETPKPSNNNSIPGTSPLKEPVILALGIGFTVTLLYILRRLW